MEKQLKGLRRVAKKKPTRLLVDVDNGEMMNVMEDDSFITIDSLPFVKVYVDEFARAIHNMPMVGFQLIHYIIIKIEKGNNLVYLAHKDVKSIVGDISRAGYYKGLKELLNREVIERTDSIHIYRVNPNMMYNGVRISKFK
jgi:hypothetical protein